jgi:rhodanese-related sulfurtransferase
MPIREVTVDELSKQLAGGARLIDVREVREFAEARVPGAELVPLRSVPEQLGAFTGDGVTYVICRSGLRSMTACEFAAARGATVANVAGGTLAWIASGREIVTGPA